jgi:reactive intermediate/imine deaminase
MGNIKYIKPSDMPNTLGPYQYGASTEGWLFIAGQIPVNPDNPDAALPATIEEQTEIVFKNIWRILKAAGYGPQHVLNVRVFLKDLLRDINGYNTVYVKQYEAGKYPSRTTVGVTALAKDALIEIDLVAYKEP